MAEVRPFCAIRYDFARLGGDLSAVIAPPYDVLDAQDKKALLAKSPYNIVAIDLPHIPPKDEGPEQVYLDAQFTLDQWQAEGVMLREPRPAIYAYNQTFTVDSRKYTRHQLLAVVRLCEFSEGVVLPHEQTFGGPKADRLALTKATRCNVSPVFGLYTDPDGVVARILASATAGRADATATLEDVFHEVWVITDSAVLKTITAAIKTKKIYIADGHHRYGTALNYRQHVMETSGGDLPPDHPANFVMLVLASMDDPGCVIQGYSRVLDGAGVSLAALRQAWAPGVAEVAAEQADLVAYDGGTKQTANFKFTNRGILDKLAADRHPAWRKLDVAYLHRYLLDELAAAKLGQPHLGYVKSIDGARRQAEETGGVALHPRATPMEHLRAVSEAGELMPQKSTYFYPKLATGLALNALSTD